MICVSSYADFLLGLVAGVAFVGGVLFLTYLGERRG